MEPPSRFLDHEKDCDVSKRELCYLYSLSFILSPFFVVLVRPEEIEKNGTIAYYCSGEVNIKLFRTANASLWGLKGSL